MHNYKIVIEVELGDDVAKVLIKNGLQICYSAICSINEARKILGLMKRNSIASLVEKFGFHQPMR